MRARVHELLSSLPGVTMREANGHTRFAVSGKSIAWLLVDHHEDGLLTLSLKAPAGQQQALVRRADYYLVPAYLGSKGWVGIDLDPAAAADWDEVVALVEQAWRMCVPSRLSHGLEGVVSR